MAITTLNSILTNKAKGLGWKSPIISAASIAGTAVAAASGFVPLTISFNSIGTTLPATLQQFPLPAGLPNELFVNSMQASHLASASTIRTAYLAYFYKMGTVDLANAAATPYDGFTHDAGWSGTIRRTILGAANTDIQLIPIIQIQTATTTTAPAFKLATSAGGAGYKNQSGSSVIGTKTFTLPAASTLTGSTYVLRLEDEDSAIVDMTQISVTTKGAAGTATIWGVELLCQASVAAAYNGVTDTVVAGLNMMNLSPGVASTGTVPSNLGLFIIGANAAATIVGNIGGVLNG